MTEMHVEYAIKKDIRNNPIVRELDRDRHRDLWGTAAIGLGLLLVVLFTAWQSFRFVTLSYQIGQLEEALSAEEELQRYLRLEIETLEAPGRIADLAADELGMTAPTMAQSVVLERVATSSLPTSASVVASR